VDADLHVLHVLMQFLFHQEDEEILEKSESLSLNKRHAIVVRLGEKRILRDALRKARELLRLKERNDENKVSRRKAGQ